MISIACNHQQTITININKNGNFDVTSINIGRVGDHDRTILNINVSNWFTECTENTVYDLMIAKEKKEPRKALSEAVPNSNGIIQYGISAIDTKESGKGTITLIAKTDNGIMMVSSKINYTVDEGISNNDDLSALAAKAELMVIHFISDGSLDDWGGKSDVRQARMELFDYATGLQCSTCVTMKPQGTSSLAYPKKNFTISCFTSNTYTDNRDVTIRKEWGKHSKYCLKANWIDPTQSCNVVSARLAAKTLEDIPALADSPNHGLIDGYPALVYLNDDCTGLYTMNIPKDAWMFNMDTSNLNHILMCAEDQLTEGAFRATATSAGWSIEVGSDTEESIFTKFNRVVSFIKDSELNTFKSNLSQYIDVDAALNYYCFAMISGATDNLGKNMLMATKDGTNWVTSLYDMDSLFGIQWDGIRTLPSDADCPADYQCNNSLLWSKIENAFFDELYARFTYLRQNQLSNNNMIAEFSNFIEQIPDALYEYDALRWLGIRKMRRSMKQMSEFIASRGLYIDAFMLKKYNVLHAVPVVRYTLAAPFIATLIEEKNINTSVKPFVDYADSFTLLCKVNKGAADGSVIFSAFSERYPNPGYIGMICRVAQRDDGLKMEIIISTSQGYVGTELINEMSDDDIKIAITNSLGKFTIYVNGTAKATGSVPGLDAVTESLMIGAELDASGTPFRFGTMNIPFFKFYSGVMKPSEITAAFA